MAPHLPDAIRRRKAPRMGERSPGSRTKSFRTCQGLRPRRAVGTLALSRSAMSPSVGIKTSAPWIMTFAAQWLAYALPCRRFACALASAYARLGADVDRYSFIASDLHRLLLAGLPAHNPLSSTRKSAIARAWPAFARRKPAKAKPAKPNSIIAHVEGSGT